MRYPEPVIRLLTFSSLYPNAMQPSHGIFVEQRLRHLLGSGQVESRVVAPVPWFPFKGQRWGRYGVLAEVPARERRHGIEVLHPRYPVIPKLGMSVAPQLMAMAMEPVLRRIVAEGYDFDLIDAHYLYPDGVAAAIIGRRMGKPVVMTARGADVNAIPRYRRPRSLIQRAASDARALVTVSRSLKDALVKLGVADDRITVLRNGVDLELFWPLDNVSFREKPRDDQFVLLSVGHLIERKGHHFVIEALTRLQGARLTIAGTGPWKDRLIQLAAACGVEDRVSFIGHVAHHELARLYNVADMLVLATRSEGMPNVVLEALACGTPVVATAVDGIPEIVSAPQAGRLMAERSAKALAQAVSALMDDYPDRATVRRYAEQFSWDETIRGQLDLFRMVVGEAGCRSGGSRDNKGCSYAHRR